MVPIRYADLVLRVAWLRVHADLLHEVDPSGRLSAHLRDFANVIELWIADGRGGVL